MITGAGTVTMTLTDALGRPVVVSQPFYASAELLTPGLQSFSAQAGAIRRNWGVLSNDYGGVAAAASYRRGLTSMLTVEASAEGAGGTFVTGAGVVANIANLAVVNLAAAVSTGDGGAGALLSAGVRRLARQFSFSAYVALANSRYRDIASTMGDPVARLQLGASAGVALGRWGSAGIAYAGVDGAVAPYRNSPFSPLASLATEHRRLLTASYSVQVRKMAFYATSYRDFARGGGTGFLLGVTIPLGSSASAGASYTDGPGGRQGQVESSRSPAHVGDWGYQAYANIGGPSHEFGQLDYKSPWALLTAGVDQAGRQTEVRVEAQGALSFLDGGLFASNSIPDSFAIVDTGGMRNIRVLSENRYAGRTDASGRLLVPDLRAYDANLISIEPDYIPADTTIAFTSRTVRPPDRAGVVVRFPVRISHGALLRLVDSRGAPLAVGGVARLLRTGVAVPVGYDGEAYVEDLAAHNVLFVELPNGRRCGVSFDYRPTPGDIPTIGPLVCKEER